MIAIVTDSTCDLGPAQLSRLNVTAVPLRVQLGDREWLDWDELDPEVLYDAMRGGGHATTAPPSAQDFAAVYRRLLGVYDEVLSVHLSGGISETAMRAREGAESLGEGGRVQVFDSGLATAPLAELMTLAAKLAAEGASIEEIVARLELARKELHVEFTVDSLDYLRRGGRLSRAGAVLGNLLGVRPVLTFEDGKIVAGGRVRGKHAVQELISRLEARFGGRPLNVVIAHAGRDRERIDALRKALEGSRLSIREGRIQMIGAVIGAHTGPHAFGFVASPADGVFSNGAVKGSTVEDRA